METLIQSLHERNKHVIFVIARVPFKLSLNYSLFASIIAILYPILIVVLP